jgi:heat shock protein HslJ
MEPDGGGGRLAAMVTTSVSARVVAALWLVVFAVAACGPAAQASLTRSAWPVTLVGSTWTAVLVGDKPTVAGSQPTAAFTTDQVKGSTGCNSYFGSYEYSRGVIKLSTMGSTAMACLDPAIEATEGRFMSAMQGASSVSIDPTGRMLLDGSGGSITFEVAPQQAS